MCSTGPEGYSGKPAYLDPPTVTTPSDFIRCGRSNRVEDEILVILRQQAEAIAQMHEENRAALRELRLSLFGRFEGQQKQPDVAKTGHIGEPKNFRADLPLIDLQTGKRTVHQINLPPGIGGYVSTKTTEGRP